VATSDGVARLQDIAPSGAPPPFILLGGLLPWRAIARMLSRIARTMRLTLPDPKGWSISSLML
jgi:hypothetical protein